MNNSALLTIKNVTFGWNSRPVIENVNFVIDKHDFVVLIGPNGGGKTTLAKIMLGLYKPWIGELRYHNTKGRPVIGYVPQFSTFDWQFPLKVREVIKMGRLRQRGILRSFNSEDEQAVEQVSQQMKIEQYLDALIGELSGGQLQRVLIARALISTPQMLILDEPTASIDADSRNLLKSILDELNQQIPIILITHDTSAISPNVTKIICINRIAYVHGPGEVDHATLEKVYGCPVELIAHGIPHRVLEDHRS